MDKEKPPLGAVFYVLIIIFETREDDFARSNLVVFGADDFDDILFAYSITI